MTETEWLAATDPTPMLAFLREAGKASDRKLRLFACACVRRVWPLLVEDGSRKAVEAAEGFADGSADKDELQQAYRAAKLLLGPEPTGDPRDVAARAAVHTAAPALRDGLYHAPSKAASTAAEAVAGFAAADQATSDELAPAVAWVTTRDAEHVAQADLLREILGPLPFREVRFDPAWVGWNDGTVYHIAEGIYDERAFDRMGVLADALLDSGCDCEEIIEHCREQGKVHVRGCWCLDLLLGRA
jgi:hypothetical protein